MAGSLLRKFGRGLALVGLELRVRLFGKDLKSTTTAPTDGQVLRYVAADDAWSPGTVSGGGSLPSGALGSLLRHDGTSYVSYSIGTAGQVLRVSGGTAVWSTLAASDVGAIAAPGSPINGGLLYYAGSWLSTGAGSLRQPLLSGGGAIAPAFGADVVPLTQRIEDGVTSAVSTCATIAHDTTGGPGADGIGARCVLRARNGSGAIADAGAIDGVLTTAAGGAEVGVVDVRARSAGTLAQIARFAASGVTMFAPATINVADNLTTGALTGLTVNRATSGTAAAGLAARIAMRVQDAGGALEDAVYLDAAWTNAGAATEASVLDVHTRTGGAAARRVLRAWASGGLWVGSQAAPYDGGDGTVTLPNAGGYCIESGGTVYQVFGRFGGANLTIGNGAFATSLNAFSIAISAGQGTAISNGWLDLSCGFRRRRTVVSNANASPTAAQSVVDMVGLTAARTVTLPAFAEGMIVTITNSDGSADGTKTISVVASSGTNNINGVTTYVGINAAYGSVTLLCDATNNRWTVIAKV